MKWLLLDENTEASGIFNFSLRQIARALDRMGIDCDLLHLADCSVREAVDTINQSKPDVIFMTSINGMGIAKQLADMPYKKCVAWWDEPVCRLVGLNLLESMSLMTSAAGFTHFVGDRVWGKRLRKMFRNHEFRLLHLASDHIEFFPSTVRYSDDLVFIGSLQSPYSLAQEVNKLDPIQQKFVRHCEQRIKDSGMYIPNLQKLLMDIKWMWTVGDATLWQHSLEDRQESLMRTFLIVWSMAKNEKRIRVLKQCIKATPTRIFAETQQKGHANMYEIRGMLDCWDKSKLLIHDTSGVTPDRLGHIYHYGKMHIDICDPQNEHDGFAYRLFQTTASARPLLVDATAGTQDIFTKEEMPRYNPHFIADSIADLTDKKLAEISEAGHQRFMADHRWENRIEKIMDRLGYKDHSAPQSEELTKYLAELDARIDTLHNKIEPTPMLPSSESNMIQATLEQFMSGLTPSPSQDSVAQAEPLKADPQAPHQEHSSVGGSVPVNP